MEKWSTRENITNKYSLFDSEFLMVCTDLIRAKNQLSKTCESEIDSFWYKFVSYDVFP